jgi:hypothetical protein
LKTEKKVLFFPLAQPRKVNICKAWVVKLKIVHTMFCTLVKGKQGYQVSKIRKAKQKLQILFKKLKNLRKKKCFFSL